MVTIHLDWAEENRNFKAYGHSASKLFRLRVSFLFDPEHEQARVISLGICAKCVRNANRLCTIFLLVECKVISKFKPCCGDAISGPTRWFQACSCKSIVHYRMLHLSICGYLTPVHIGIESLRMWLWNKQKSITRTQTPKHYDLYGDRQGNIY